MRAARQCILHDSTLPVMPSDLHNVSPQSVGTAAIGRSYSVQRLCGDRRQSTAISRDGMQSAHTRRR